MPRVLIVEDDNVQQAVMKSALERRGYQTEVASDGLSAVRMLRSGGFDLALIDYQLPEIDGFASAQLVHDLMNEEDRPKLIAITAAPDKLSSRAMSANVFDAIIPKPLDLATLLTAVEAQLHATTAGQTARAAEALWRGLGLVSAPAVLALPPPSPAQAQLLRCYFDLSGRREPEAVLLLGPESADDAVAARTLSHHFDLPFVNLTTIDVNADATFSAADHKTWGAVAAVIMRFRERCQSISRGLIEAADIDTRILVFLFLSGRLFEPSLSFSTPQCAHYPGFFPDGEARLAAERLAGRGLVDRRFFERFHACGNCGSSRLNIREECQACHSAQLRDVSLIHHFRCAHQAPEADFVSGPHLVCPKCRQHLRHYGSDYDKPGIATSCGDCGTLSPEPDVGFVCLDCGARTGGDAADKRDVFSYALTTEGIALLRRGTARLTAGAPQSNAPLPEAIKIALADSRPVAALVEVRYHARGHILARRGETGFSGMRRLFLENLLNAIEGECVVASSPETDHILIRNAPPEALAELGPALLEACQEVLAEGLEPELRFLDCPLAVMSQ
jgi:CheY-like chemotaxis protein